MGVSEYSSIANFYRLQLSPVPLHVRIQEGNLGVQCKFTCLRLFSVSTSSTSRATSAVIFNVNEAYRVMKLRASRTAS